MMYALPRFPPATAFVLAMGNLLASWSWTATRNTSLYFTRQLFPSNPEMMTMVCFVTSQCFMHGPITHVIPYLITMPWFHQCWWIRWWGTLTGIFYTMCRTGSAGSSGVIGSYSSNPGRSGGGSCRSPRPFFSSLLGSTATSRDDS